MDNDTRTKDERDREYVLILLAFDQLEEILAKQQANAEITLNEQAATRRTDKIRQRAAAKLAQAKLSPQTQPAAASAPSAFVPKPRSPSLTNLSNGFGSPSIEPRRLLKTQEEFARYAEEKRNEWRLRQNAQGAVMLQQNYAQPRSFVGYNNRWGAAAAVLHGTGRKPIACAPLRGGGSAIGGPSKIAATRSLLDQSPRPIPVPARHIPPLESGCPTPITLAVSRDVEFRVKGAAAESESDSQTWRSSDQASLGLLDSNVPPNAPTGPRAFRKTRMNDGSHLLPRNIRRDVQHQPSHQNRPSLQNQPNEPLKVSVSGSVSRPVFGMSTCPVSFAPLQRNHLEPFASAGLPQHARATEGPKHSQSTAFLMQTFRPKSKPTAVPKVVDVQSPIGVPPLWVPKGETTLRKRQPQRRARSGKLLLG